MRSRTESSFSVMHRVMHRVKNCQMTRWLAWSGFVFAMLGGAADLRADSEAVASPPATLGELLAGFKETTGLEARFEEEKYLALLAAPLLSSGRLFFSPPSSLLRRVEKPRPQDILITGSQVRISDESGERLIDLDARGEVRPLVESMIWIFTGDIESLERTYRVDYQVLEGLNGEGKRWQVRLVPRHSPLSQLVRELRVSGRDRAADTLELVETTGDRTVTHIIDVNPQRRFDDAERREFFASP